MKIERVYILGAGCSVNYGYPLAKDFVAALKTYGSALWSRPNCEQFRKTVADTVALMEKFRTPTIDRLCRRIELECSRARADQGVWLDKPTADLKQKGREAILAAKAVTVAMFLEREAEARSSGLPGYGDFLVAIFGGSRGLDDLKNTSSAVLSFNYDRLFEMAFLDYFGLDGKKQCYTNQFLNSGLEFLSGQANAIVPDRFCFLKLHGTAAVWVAKRDGEPEISKTLRLDGTNLTIDDSLLWPSGQNLCLLPGERPEPLIVFPHEKEHALASGTSLVYAKYIEGIWKHAGELIREAKQIWLIGYSFDPNDRRTVMDVLLQQKTGTREIVVQNPAAESICNELRLRYPDLAASFRPLANSF